MGFANRAIVAAGLGFAVSALVGCGGSGSLLSSSQADRLSAQLEQAKQDLALYRCRDAASDINGFRSSVDGLSSVNATLIQNLDQGAQTIQQLAATECPVQTQTQPVKTHTTTTTTTTTSTTPTTTTNTATDTYTQTEPTTTVITLSTPTSTSTTSTGGETTTGTDTNTAPSGGTGFGDTTTTVTDSTGFGDGAQGTG